MARAEDILREINDAWRELTRPRGPFVAGIGAASARLGERLNEITASITPPLLLGSLSLFSGFQVIVSHHLTKEANIARSPSRALRRWKRGTRKVSPFGQIPNPDAIVMGDKIMVHPITYERLKLLTAVRQSR